MRISEIDRYNITEDIIDRVLFDLLVKAGHMRMVLEGDIWKLRNTRAKDLELLKAIGYEPDTEYNPI